MKTILFDLLTSQPEGKTRYNGGAEYIYTVFRYMAANYADNDNFTFIFYYDKNKYLDEWILNSIKKMNAIVCDDVEKPSMIKNVFEKYKIDVFFTGLAIRYDGSMIPKNVKVVATIHGLRSIEMPCDRYSYLYYSGRYSLELFLIYRIRRIFSIFQQRKREKFQKIVDYVDEIVCVSNHTKYAIYDEFENVSLDRIHVFYAPIKYLGKNKDENKVESIPKDKYILMMSANRWVKNIYRGILAIDTLFSKGKLADYKVYIVGTIPPRIEKKIVNRNRFVVYDYLEEKELEQMYMNCDIFFYPTLNEGFGIPPEEVMRYGKTCVVSAITSLPEVYGDSVYYVNPYDIGEMSKRILQASESKIPLERIEMRMNYLLEKQEKALAELCDFIVNA